MNFADNIEDMIDTQKIHEMESFTIHGKSSSIGKRII